MAKENFSWYKLDSFLLRISKGQYVLRKKLFGGIKPIKFKEVNEEVQTNETHPVTHIRNVGLRSLSREELDDLINKVINMINNGGDRSLQDVIDAARVETEYREQLENLETPQIKIGQAYKFPKTYHLHTNDTTDDDLSDLKAFYENAINNGNLNDNEKAKRQVILDNIDAEIKFRQDKGILESSYPAERVSYIETIDEPIRRVTRRLKSKRGIAIVWPWQYVMGIDFNDFTLDTPKMTFDAEVINGFTETFIIDFDYSIALDDYNKFIEKINADEALTGKSNVKDYLSKTLGKRLDSLVRTYLLDEGVNKVFEGTSQSAKMGIVLEEKRDELDALCKEYGFRLVDLMCSESSRPKLTDEEITKINAILQMAKANGQTIDIKDALLYSSGKNNVLFGGNSSAFLGGNQQAAPQPAPQPAPQSAPDNDNHLDNFINAGYMQYKRLNAGYNDEQIAALVAGEIASQKNKFNLDYNVALNLVRIKLNLNPSVNNGPQPQPAPVNSQPASQPSPTPVDNSNSTAQNDASNDLFITVEDVENAKRFLISKGLKEESISNDFIAQLFCSKNPSLNKEDVLKVLNCMNEPTEIINAAIEQIKSEGNLFISTEELFAYRLSQILSEQGITIDEESAKKYFSSLNNSNNGPKL